MHQTPLSQQLCSPKWGEGREFFNQLKKQKHSPKPHSQANAIRLPEITLCASQLSHAMKTTGGNKLKEGRFTLAHIFRCLTPRSPHSTCREYIMCITAEGRGIRKPLNYDRGREGTETDKDNLEQPSRTESSDLLKLLHSSFSHLPTMPSDHESMGS